MLAPFVAKMQALAMFWAVQVHQHAGPALGWVERFDTIGPHAYGGLVFMGDLSVINFQNTRCDTTQSFRTDFRRTVWTKLMIETTKQFV